MNENVIQCVDQSHTGLSLKTVCHNGNDLFNDALDTFYLRLYGVKRMMKDHSAREETRCRHIGYCFRLAARVLLYASSYRQDNTYHGLCYTNRGTLAEREIAQWVNRFDDISHHE